LGGAVRVGAGPGRPIQRIDYQRPFDECLTLAESLIDAALQHG
jgi:hypothetical protein